MSRFTQPVSISQLKGSDRLWQVDTVDLGWEVGRVGSGLMVEIPHQFQTDLASVPRIFWSLLPPFGRHTNASILHDYLYRTRHPRGRRWADRQFLEAMNALDTPRVRARIMWMAVRVFGARSWWAAHPG